MDRASQRIQRRRRRKQGLRKTLVGTPARPRLTVFRSLKHVYAQVIDDLQGVTIASASTADKNYQGPGQANKDAAAQVGKLIAQRAAEKGVSQVAFDRNGYKYHGRVRALADAAREAGLKF